MTFAEDLSSHLDKFQTAPFLFVGSGFSRRYADTADWVGLLRIFARAAGKEYERYSASANGINPAIASLIADDFFDVWWDSPEYESSRAKFPAPAGRSSPLKYEVAQHFAGVTSELPKDGPLNDELEYLRNATLDGIITTNFDGILEYIFRDFVPYVGQDELLFRDPLGVGEIYKIHGSFDRPESLVLTSADYDRYRQRNPYLAAKLLTTFVEHPVIFLGYSLSDENVREILMSIVAILTRENIDQLKDRLIFVDWAPSTEPTLMPSSIPFEGASIPIQLVRTDSFREIFEVLAALRRRFPARILRHLKSQIYDLVRTNEPTAQVVVTDLESDTDLESVDVVIGVGVAKTVEEALSDRGVVGMKRRDLLLDVLEPKAPRASYKTIVENVLPDVLALGGHANAPVYMYLRGMGALNDDGTLNTDVKLPHRVRARAIAGMAPLAASSGYFEARANTLVAHYGSIENLAQHAYLSDALIAIPALDPATTDLERLRIFLLANQSAFASNQATQWAKCVCFYDLASYRKLSVS